MMVVECDVDVAIVERIELWDEQVKVNWLRLIIHFNSGCSTACSHVKTYQSWNTLPCSVRSMASWMRWWLSKVGYSYFQNACTINGISMNEVVVVEGWQPSLFLHTSSLQKKRRPTISCMSSTADAEWRGSIETTQRTRISISIDTELARIKNMRRESKYMRSDIRLRVSGSIIR